MRVTVVALAFLATVSTAVQAAVPGFNLGWTNCSTLSSSQNLNFACDDNTLTKHLILSFRLAADLPDYVAAAAMVDYVVAADSPMPWWGFGPGECREGALAPVPVPDGIGGCTSPYIGAAQGGGYAMERLGANRWRLRAQWARDSEVPLTANVRYAAIVLALTTARSFDDGSGLCEGCDRQACFAVLELSAFGWPSGVEHRIESVDVRDHVTYQGPGPYDYACITPTRPSTWGAVKALYR